MGEKKIILYVVEAMGGGVFTYIVEMANSLVNQYDLYIAYSIRPQTPSNFKEYFDPRIHLIEIRSFVRSIRPYKDAAAFVELARLRKEVHPDIIHLHSAKAGVLGTLAFSFYRAPLFYTPHGYSFLMENMSSLKRYCYYMIEKLCAMGSRTTVSYSLGEHLETLKLTKRAKYVNNGIDLQEVDKYLSQIRDVDKQVTCKSHFLIVFTLGRICYQKNPELFGEIARRMPDVHFIWIGSEEACAYLQTHNIEITGWLDRASALAWALEADVFILTSRWEGLPVSLLEAMYMNKLCVVSDVIGNRDVIHNEKNGFVCTTPEEFCAAIHKAENISQRTELCRAAQEEIMKEYNITSMANKYKAIYQETLCNLHEGGRDRLKVFHSKIVFSAARKVAAI